jgi:hypothetical protein
MMEEIQRNLLEMVAKTMNTDTTGMQEQDLQDENSPLNVNTYNIKLVLDFI